MWERWEFCATEIRLSGIDRFPENTTRQGQQSKHPKVERLEEPHSLGKRCLRSVRIPQTKWDEWERGG